MREISEKCIKFEKRLIICIDIYITLRYNKSMEVEQINLKEMLKMIQVSSKEFFEKIGPLNVVLTVEGNYPYKTIFKFRNGIVVGYIQDFELGIGLHFLREDLNEI